MGSWVEKTLGKAVAGGLGWERLQLAEQVAPHLRADELGGRTRERDRPCNPEFQHREIKPQSL